MLSVLFLFPYEEKYNHYQISLAFFLNFPTLKNSFTLTDNSYDGSKTTLSL